jgi:hypothetical protein
VLRKLVVGQMIKGCPDRDDFCHLRRVYEWWRDHLAYIPDPVGIDLYPTPLEALRVGGEDCDGHVIAVCASLAAIGFAVGCRVIRTRPDIGSQWHVYSIAGIPRSGPAEMVPLDTTWQGASGPGDELPAAMCAYRKDWLFDLR